MTPKDKAKELFDKMIYNVSDNVIIQSYDIELWKNTFKQCALIAVDELIKEENKYNNGSFYPSKYWQEVKQEIEKL